MLNLLFLRSRIYCKSWEILTFNGRVFNIRITVMKYLITITQEAAFDSLLLAVWLAISELLFIFEKHSNWYVRWDNTFSKSQSLSQ